MLVRGHWVVAALVLAYLTDYNRCIDYLAQHEEE
jgi:hypothetical protein